MKKPKSKQKVCSRGHKFQGSGPCPVCWPGFTREKRKSKNRDNLYDMKSAGLLELQTIPGIGKSIAGDLWNIGIRKVADLKNKVPEELYRHSNKFVGATQDRCLLYVFRSAVYFAEGGRDPEKLKW